MTTITDIRLEIENKIIDLKNPEKLYWPEENITKLEFVETMTFVAPFLVKYSSNRPLTSIRYPHGINDKSFFQKEKPQNTPDWVKIVKSNDKNHITLNSAATLIWLCTQAALELHTGFNFYDKPDHPSHLVFDLDPDDDKSFDDVLELAGRIHETLVSLEITGFVKTSGATGLQILIPSDSRYDYDTARKLNEFFAKYFVEKMSSKVTIERMKKNRGGKIYFDWQQMWYGKTIITPYSARAVKYAGVSTPLEWEELNIARPEKYNLKNIVARLKEKGDLLEPSLRCNNRKQLDEILKQISKK